MPTLPLMDSSRYIEALVHRRIAARYAGASLSFDLSRALFSSAGVDTGTVALLRELEQFGERIRGGAVVDTGCGTGTLGISLAAAFGAGIRATDRDALACWFTERNARLNGVTCETEIRLGVSDPAGLASPAAQDGAATGRRNRAKLLVCNIPAKAGEPVIRELIARHNDAALNSATRDQESEPGTPLVGLVVVSPLAGLMLEELHRLGVKLVSRRETSSHLAVVFAPERSTETADDQAASIPSAYVRKQQTFHGPHGSYALTVAHNLPEFDSLHYATELAFRVIRRQPPGGRLLVWGAGQGHLVVGGLPREAAAHVTVADRDLLAVKTTAANLAVERPRSDCTQLPAAGISAAVAALPERSRDWMVVRSEPESGSLWAEEVTESASYLLKNGGHLLVASRSTGMARLAPQLRSAFTQLDSVRNRGYRVDLLVRKH